ncbi:hypothetical protein E1J38_009580 [Seonamhaeicola sediminis]|uniref:Uncharacterized protein n=1 Tax=Seonamhaeicola sediminis TaxID=2528206 RepID=A0A562YCB4_9FLAO|nr:hypothetical protein [Seonamhaeicola sediminis]TWO32074.1 hypothetical protein E1J38_009580 [Seonamhaeicola sediminis]
MRKQLSGKNIYKVTIKNIGGLVMPVTIEWVFTDGTKAIDKLQAQIWRRNEYIVTQTFVKYKKVETVSLDPNFEFPDSDVFNNTFPKLERASEFEKFKNNNRK